MVLTKVKPLEPPHHDDPVQSEQEQESEEAGQDSPEDGVDEPSEPVVEEQDKGEPVEQTTVCVLGGSDQSD